MQLIILVNLLFMLLSAVCILLYKQLISTSFFSLSICFVLNTIWTVRCVFIYFNGRDEREMKKKHCTHNTDGETTFRTFLTICHNTHLICWKSLNAMKLKKSIHNDMDTQQNARTSKRSYENKSVSRHRCARVCVCFCCSHTLIGAFAVWLLNLLRILLLLFLFCWKLSQLT